MSSDTTVTEFDYKWVTEQLTKVANTHCNGRIVSILEGGYSTKSGPISPLAQSVSSHVRALFKSDYSHIPSDLAHFQLACKSERSLLKKRRADKDLDQNPHSFMKMKLRSKR